MQFKTLQTSHQLNFPTVDCRLVNVRVFVLCSLFNSLTDGVTGINWEIGPSVFIVDKVVEEDYR